MLEQEQNSPPSAGVGIVRFFWGCVVTGGREALIEGGYAVAPLPGDPGANKWTMKALDPQGREISVRRMAKNRFEVHRDWGAEEAAAYASAEEKQRAQREEREQAERLVASWPKSAEQYRDESRFPMQWADGLVNEVFAGGNGGGYRFDQAAIDRAKFLLDQLRMLHESGAIVMDAALREQITPSCIAKRVKAADVARNDRAFQEFMREVAKR